MYVYNSEYKIYKTWFILVLYSFTPSFNCKAIAPMFFFATDNGSMNLDDVIFLHNITKWISWINNTNNITQDYTNSPDNKKLDFKISKLKKINKKPNIKCENLQFFGWGFQVKF